MSEYVITHHPRYQSVFFDYGDADLHSHLERRLTREWPSQEDFVLSNIFRWNSDIKKAEFSSMFLLCGRDFPMSERDLSFLEQAVLGSEDEEIAINVTAYLMFREERRDRNKEFFDRLYASKNPVLSSLGKLRLGYYYDVQ